MTYLVKQFIHTYVGRLIVDFYNVITMFSSAGRYYAIADLVKYNHVVKLIIIMNIVIPNVTGVFHEISDSYLKILH